MPELEQYLRFQRALQRVNHPWRLDISASKLQDALSPIEERGLDVTAKTQRILKNLYAELELPEQFRAFTDSLVGLLKDIRDIEAEFHGSKRPNHHDMVVMGLTVKDWIPRLQGTLHTRLMTTVRLALAERVSLSVIRDRVRGTRVAKYQDGILRATLVHLDGLTRTSVAAVSTTTREDYIRGDVRFLAPGETSACKDHHQKIFDKRKGPRPPSHWRCRAFIIPASLDYSPLPAIKPDYRPMTVEQFRGEVLQ